MIKKTITTISIILFSLTAFSQINKSDSLAIVEKNKILIEIVTKTPIKEFQEWLNENLIAKQYNETFAAWYNAFVEFKFKQQELQKQVPNKTQPKK